VQKEALGGRDHGAYAAWSWVLGHLPPPPGVELHIACRTSRHTAPAELAYKGAQFHLIPVAARARVFCLFQFDWRYYRPLAARLQAEVIHGWGTEDSYGVTALRLGPDRHLIQVQGNLNAYRQRVPMPWDTAFGALSERLVLRRARWVVAENDYALGSARPWIRTRCVRVVEHPIRPAFLGEPPSAGAGKQVLFVGALQERKGIWDALEAFRQSAPAAWTMAIIGAGGPAAERALKEWVARNHLQSRVSHYREIGPAQIVSIMQASSVFLLPTRIDTGPTALKEALAMGLWPVCYDNSGPAHYIRKFEYGSLAEDLNRASLASVLKTVLQSAPWKEPAREAKIRSQIRPHFDRANIWPQLLEVYREIQGTTVKP
jgi:glycosyltransferase involved in cell wall biosynthesis